MIGQLLASLFGGGKNVITETVEVFRPNAENEAARTAAFQQAALAQLAAEFGYERKGWYDRFIDGLNRLPRPMMALGVIALFVSAMFQPIWFSERMVGLQLVPEQLWWLLGAIVTFYFGARSQIKQQDFQKSVASTLARVPNVVESLQELSDLSPQVADTGVDSEVTIDVVKNDTVNPALDLLRGKL